MSTWLTFKLLEPREGKKSLDPEQAEEIGLELHGTLARQRLYYRYKDTQLLPYVQETMDYLCDYVVFSQFMDRF